MDETPLGPLPPPKYERRSVVLIKTSFPFFQRP